MTCCYFFSYFTNKFPLRLSDWNWFGLTWLLLMEHLCCGHEYWICLGFLVLKEALMFKMHYLSYHWIARRKDTHSCFKNTGLLKNRTLWKYLSPLAFSLKPMCGPDKEGWCLSGDSPSMVPPSPAIPLSVPGVPRHYHQLLIDTPPGKSSSLSSEKSNPCDQVYQSWLYTYIWVSSHMWHTAVVLPITLFGLHLSWLG